ncbi:MAG TPA: hypothetical protein ENO22_13345, partial [candidate division Zixibacteria bacterium]|nr:hypothetical protein [candidate division Zixibacteria bacterium]
MLKKLSVILFLAIFVLSMTAAARDLDVKAGLTNNEAGREAKLFADGRDEAQVMSMVKPYGTQSIAQTFAPTRQFYSNEITIRDMWHNTAPGRNIFYGGYYNAGCDYVYMNFPDRYFIGSSPYSAVRGAIFDWSVGGWDFTVGGGLQLFGIIPSYYPNQSANPKDGQGVIGFHSFPGAGTSGWSHAGFAGP